MTVWILVTAALGAALSWLSCRFLVLPLLRRRGVMDRPSERSSHEVPVVRGGGLAVMSGFLPAAVLGMLGYGLASGEYGLRSLVTFDAPGISVLAMGTAFGFIGLVDDLDSLSASTRLLAQVGVGIIFAAGVMLLLGVGFFAGAVIAVSVVYVVNAVNFMDGLNTLITGWTLVCALWFTLLGALTGSGSIAIAAVALALAAAAFLPFNTNPAQAFLGDVGSYAIGGATVALAWMSWAFGMPVVAVLAPFVVPAYDVLRTLIVRMYLGENIFQAHKSHLYQRMHQAGLSHETVARIHAGAALVCILASVPAVLTQGWAGELVAVSIWALVLVFYSYGPRFVKEHRAKHHGSSSNNAGGRA